MAEGGQVYNLKYDISLMYDKQVGPHLQVWHIKAGSSLHDSTVCIIQRTPHVIFVCLNGKVKRLQAGTEHTSWSLSKGCVCAPQLWTAARYSALLFQKTPKNTHRLPSTMKEFPGRFHLGIRHVFAWLSHFPNLMKGIKSTNAVETCYNFTYNLWEEGKTKPWIQSDRVWIKNRTDRKYKKSVHRAPTEHWAVSFFDIRAFISVEMSFRGGVNFQSWMSLTQKISHSPAEEAG